MRVVVVRGAIVNIKAARMDAEESSQLRAEAAKVRARLLDEHARRYIADTHRGEVVPDSGRAIEPRDFREDRRNNG